MPILHIANHPPELGWRNSTLKMLAAALRDACVAASVPGIDSKDKVTVTAGASQLIEDDRRLVIFVEGLLDKPERTREVRDRLAHSLARCAKEHLPSHWGVEVLVKRFNDDKDVYLEIPPGPTPPPAPPTTDR